MSHKRIRSLNKHVVNRITRRFARFSRGPFALIPHVGRRSGKPYEAPIMVEPSGDRFVIALTYGPEVDWYRNVLAAGGATLTWHGTDYALGRPEPLPAQAALPLYSRVQSPILRLLGTQHFVSMRVRARNSSPETTPS